MRAKTPNKGKVAVIGGGWFGCQTARSLHDEGYEVTVLEKNAELFGGCSGKFGIRAHTGPHYPRSPVTRQECQRGLKEFEAVYPELLTYHSHSIYALSDDLDAEEHLSHVTPRAFRKVSQEVPGVAEIKPQDFGYEHVNYAVDIPSEPTIAVGPRPGGLFQKFFKEANITVKYECTIINAQKDKHTKKITLIDQNGDSIKFDHVVNATGFQSLLPEGKLPNGMKVTYQTCLALRYQDSSNEPYNPYIVMDGLYPCTMPLDTRKIKSSTPTRDMIITHGKWTILGSYDTPEEANKHLAKVNDKFINTTVRPRSENSMKHYWPGFEGRFKYKGWIGTVLAKPVADGEFRSSVVFKDQRNGVIYVTPGKVTNIFSASREVEELIKGDDSKILSSGNFCYVKQGVLDAAKDELNKPIAQPQRNTGLLQPYADHGFSTKRPPRRSVSAASASDSSLLIKRPPSTRMLTMQPVLGNESPTLPPLGGCESQSDTLPYGLRHRLFNLNYSNKKRKIGGEESDDSSNDDNSILVHN